ncbi:site-specific integrase [Sphingobium sp. PNB]|uniref:tyrosine-type recombinase/integrase n=1 Tax=Sphingobium sp. PNB TaxID=863934 RepID=UPI001CA40CBC|nr:site-specific integrase [Sphingobium sp. PNB]MCB4862935.1 site-specific integrase [Sphingobium sp. PNB]
MPKGLYIRNGIYWARFKVKGHEYRESLRTRSEQTALKRLAALKKAVEERVYYGAADPISWQAAVVSWHERGPRAMNLKPRTFDRYVTSLAQLRPWLDDKELQRIDVKLLKTIVTDRQRLGVTNATIRRDMTAISSVLAHCADMHWIEDNPARMIDRSRFKEARTKIILPRSEYLEAVFADPSRFMDMARFAQETGMREDEIAGLEHDRVDRGRMSVTVENTKGNRVREVPLTRRALEIIDQQPRHIRYRFVFWSGDGHRFRNVPSRFYAKVSRAAQKAAREKREFQRFRFHDLRHLYAVDYLRKRRGSLYDLQQILGHASIVTTERYLDHLTTDERKAALFGVAQNEAQDQRFAEEKGGGNG